MTSKQSMKLPNTGDRLADRYTIVRRASLGGFGAVYKAVQDTLGREVAIKVLLPEIFINKDYVEQFRQEALLTSQLSHPNTITVFDYGQIDNGLLFLVMEWLEGKTLTEALREDHAFKYERAYTISHQILKSLAEAHDRGMVHRDLKPSNLFLSEQYGESEFVKVLDFGLVKNLDPKRLTSLSGMPISAPKFTEKRRAPGTPHYMAPEQATGKGTTTASDIYSFGLILYEMLTGTRAFDGADKMQVLLKQARDPCPPLPTELQNTFLGKIVKLCVNKKPSKRPQKAGDLVRIYQRAAEDSSGVSLHTTEIRTTDSWKALSETKSSDIDLHGGPTREFVGRQSELEEFDEIVRHTIETNEGSLICLLGEAGIGKTALTERFAQRFIEKSNGRVMRGGYLPRNKEAMSGMRCAIREILGLVDEAEEDVRHQIRKALQSLDVNNIYLLNFLSNFLFGSFGERPDQFDECTERLATLFGELTSERPLLLILDHLHWSDQTSLDLLWRLTTGSFLSQHPLIVTIAFRNGGSGRNIEFQLALERLDRLGHNRYRELRLGPLSKRECLRLVENAIEIQRDVARKCLTLSRGNPLWLEIVIRYLIDEAEHIRRKITQGELKQGDASLFLPNAFDKIMLRRVEQVARKYAQESFREVLMRASVLSNNFQPALLECVLKKERKYELLDRMTWTLEVWRREGVLRRLWPTDEQLEFVHEPLVEFLAAEAPPRLHLIVARAKEELSRDLDGDPTARADLARHFRAAGEKRLAIQHLHSAAVEAHKQRNHSLARDLFQELLPLLTVEEHQTLRKQTHLALGELTRRLHELGPSCDYFDAALALARADQDRETQGMALCGRAELALQQAHFEEATRYFQLARSSLSNNKSPTYGRVLLGGGHVSARRGDWGNSRSCFNSAYHLGTERRDHSLVGQALFSLGEVEWAMGAVRPAHEFFEQALQFYRTAHATDEEGNTLRVLARTTLAYRNIPETSKRLEESLSIKQRLGDIVGIAHTLTAMGEYEVDQLNISRAQKLGLKALNTFKNLGDRTGSARCQDLLASVHFLLGQYTPARRLSLSALSFFEDNGELWEQVRILGRIAYIDILEEKLPDAHGRLNSTLTLLDVHGSEAHRGQTLNALALIYEMRGDFEKALSKYQAAYEVGQQVLQIPPQFEARLGILRINIFQRPGRWYYDELWEMLQAARSYALPGIYLKLLSSLVWFEGVFGDQRSWKGAVDELQRVLKENPIPIETFKAPLDLSLLTAQRHLTKKQADAYTHSADWLTRALQGLQRS